MGLRLLSLAFWGFLGVTSILLFPVALLIWLFTAPFDPRKRLLHQFTCFWASLYTWFNPAWPVEILGREKIRSDTAYVMVANHLSFLDILVLHRLFWHFKWVSKVENFRVPFIGWNMTLNGYIRLRRGNKESVMQMMRSCCETLQAGNSIMMFPEGTRSPNGRIRAFKTGAFEIAREAQCPLLPIVLAGTSNALPKRVFVLRGRHPIRMQILDEIPYASFADQDIAETTSRVHELIVAHLPKPKESPAANALA